MADEKPLVLPDRVLIGGKSRYDFLGWMADLAIQPGMEAEKYLATLWGQKCSHARWRKLAGILLPDASRNDGADSARGC